MASYLSIHPLVNVPKREGHLPGGIFVPPVIAMNEKFARSRLVLVPKEQQTTTNFTGICGGVCCSTKLVVNSSPQPEFWSFDNKIVQKQHQRMKTALRKASTNSRLSVRSSVAAGLPKRCIAATLQQPQRSFGTVPDSYDESKKKYYFKADEVAYKLGKHRSNALELIDQHDIIEVEGEVVVCDGGGGAMGHPLEYISLARPGEIVCCVYCGLKFKNILHTH